LERIGLKDTKKNFKDTEHKATSDIRTVVSHADNNLYNCFLSILILKIGAIIQTMKGVLLFRTTHTSYTQWHIYVFGA
jgi:hypothetical protein